MKSAKLSDGMWKSIETLLKNDKDKWRGKSAKKRQFIDGVLSLLINKKIFSTRLNWSNLVTENGNSASYCRTFNRWRNDGTWEKLIPLFAKRANYSWIAELGTYEVLLKDGKSLIKINKAIKDNYDMERNNLCEDIEKEKNHNEELKQEIEKLKKVIKEKEDNISKLTKTINKFKNNEHIKKLNREHIDEIHKIQNEVINLKRFNRIYVARLYQRNYRPSSKNTDQAFIDNFWSVAKTFKNEQ